LKSSKESRGRKKQQKKLILCCVGDKGTRGQTRAVFDDDLKTEEAPSAGCPSVQKKKGWGDLGQSNLQGCIALEEESRLLRKDGRKNPTTSGALIRYRWVYPIGSVDQVGIWRGQK